MADEYIAVYLLVSTSHEGIAVPWTEMKITQIGAVFTRKYRNKRGVKVQLAPPQEKIKNGVVTPKSSIRPFFQKYVTHEVLETFSTLPHSYQQSYHNPHSSFNYFSALSFDVYTSFSQLKWEDYLFQAR